ncbi:D-sedoheptulose-7-phosphate isomerase [Gaoshiqia sp. Z1-71]|uniref:D-sedoheptulose-7-phosphate isomerase n=1 Tax=Gaoshiqia hydrogeniformans TaxID=3290090 RepID=UPI003BF890F7
MKHSDFLYQLTERYPQLIPLQNDIKKAAEALIGCYQQGRKVLICGNGGSCSDSGHMAGELMKGFERARPLRRELKSRLEAIAGERGAYLAEKLQQALPAISLAAHNALITAVSNDMDADLIFAQQVVGYGMAGDVLIAISSSGNSRNVVDAVITAKARGLLVIGLTGETGGQMNAYCDILIRVPEQNTAFIQELHLPVYHTLCLVVEDHFFAVKH